MNRFSTSLKSLAISGLLAAGAFAQPTPAPADGDLACSAGGASPVDTTFAARQDTVVSTPDADGFLSLFDGKSFKGWWQNCRSTHSSGNAQGAIWRIDTARKAIYSTQRNGNIGGLLSTKKRYLHYEVVFETWAGFGNDAGFFHRNRVSGRCYQTVLDYLSGASFGGTWGEGGFPSRDHRPHSFNGNDTTLSFGTAPVNWTAYTANRIAAGENFPCASTGCVQADWRATWKPSSHPTDGWNTVRIKFYGGTAKTGQSVTTPGADRVRMRSWYKSRNDTASRVAAIQWIPIWGDSMAYTGAQVDSFGVPNPVAFQVHGGGRFGAARGTWYRNIRIRELDSLGVPLPVVTSIKSGSARQARYTDLKLTSGLIGGSMDLAHEIVVTNLQGRVLRTYKGPAGTVQYALPSGNSLLLVRIKTARGTETLKVNRVD